MIRGVIRFILLFEPVGTLQSVLVRQLFKHSCVMILLYIGYQARCYRCLDQARAMVTPAD